MSVIEYNDFAKQIISSMNDFNYMLIVYTLCAYTIYIMTY